MLQLINIPKKRGQRRRRDIGFLITSALIFSMTSQAQSLEESMARGKQLYINECITCHMENGEGITGAFPPLANSDYFRDDPSKAIAAILNGLEGEVTVNGETYYGVMDPVKLTNQELSDLLNYIQNSWGGKAKELTAKDIEKMK